MFELLYRRELGDFAHRLAIAQQSGTADQWTALGSAWLALANCQHIELETSPPATARPNSLVQALRATVLLESSRRLIEVAESLQEQRPRSVHTLFAEMEEPRFFRRQPSNAMPRDRAQQFIVWPGERERWIDELPGAMSIESQCERLREDVAKSLDAQPDAFSARYERLFAAIDRVLEHGQRLGDSANSGSVATLLWRVRLYGATKAHALRRHHERLLAAATEHTAVTAALTIPAKNRAKKPTEPGQRDKPTSDAAPDIATQIAFHRGEIARYIDLTRSYVKSLTAPDSGPDPGSIADARAAAPAALAQAAFLLAILARQAGDVAHTLAWLDTALGLPLDPVNMWAARYLRLRVLAQADERPRIAASTDALPPADSAYYGAYAYRLASAARAAGADKRFLALAKAAFRDKPYKSDPHLRALYSQVLHHLAEYRFEPRVVEIVEELGPRSETFSRVEELARIALDRGNPDHAVAAANWLADKHRNARYRPTYFALHALAAFSRDDLPTFKQAIADMTHRSTDLLDALPRHRQARFFARADREFARILRHVLPVMAEWGNAREMRARRQKWLRAAVEEIQRFLRTTGESVARGQLIELYRLASALLETHPRGYAERLGTMPPLPLILGTVRVEGEDLTRHEPAVDLYTSPPVSLTLVPRDRVPASEWLFTWPDREDKGQGASP